MVEDIKAAFKYDDKESLKFERIPKQTRLSNRPDLHAFLLLDKLVPGETDMVSNATHDEIFLEVSPEDLAKVVSEEQVVELIRCGVHYSSEYDCLVMFT